MTAPVPSSSNSAVPPPNLPPAPDAGKWDDAAEQFQTDLLATVQSSAGVWSGAVGTFLGLFGSVAIITGGSDVTSLNTWQKVVTIAATVAAGLLGAWGLYLLTQAQALPSFSSENWNGEKYRAYVIGKSDIARRNLDRGRKLGLAAAAIVFAVGVFVLIAAATA